MYGPLGASLRFADKTRVGSSSILPNTLTNLAAWYKSDTDTYTDTVCTNPATTNNANVRGWKDQSGNNRTLTAGGTSIPLLKTNIINGKSVINFDAVNDAMDFGATFNLADFTILGVYCLTSISGTQNIFGTQVDASSNRIGHTSATNLTYVGNGGISVSTTISSMIAGTFYVHAYDSSAHPNYYRRGILDATSAGTYSADMAFDQIAAAVYASPINGQIAELVIYSDIKSASDILGVSTYLAGRYAL